MPTVRDRRSVNGTRKLMAMRLFGGAGLLGALLLAGLAGRAVAAEPDGPGFDCRRASTLVERTICTDTGLAKQDAAMAAFSARELPVLVGTGESELVRKNHRMWLGIRNRCNQRPQTVKACLSDFYDRRLVGLAIDTLFRDPEAAFAVIREKSPRILPIYQALYVYATTPDHDRRARNVAAILTASFETADFKGKGAGPDGDGDWLSLEDAPMDDKRFSAFLMTASFVQAREQGFGGMPIPCAAILNRPGLIDALNSFWGSTLDFNFPRTDCLTVQPLPATVQALFAKAAMATPCEGTICVSSDRYWVKVQVAVSLHLVARIRSFTEPCEAKTNRFLRANQRMSFAAQRDLAEYYRTRFNLAGERAVKDANDAIQQALQQRFTSIAREGCEPS